MLIIFLGGITRCQSMKGSLPRDCLISAYRPLLATRSGLSNLDLLVILCLNIYPPFYRCRLYKNRFIYELVREGFSRARERSSPEGCFLFFFFLLSFSFYH